MAKRVKQRARLAEVQQWLTSWRDEHGGRGRPIPEELWEAAADVAQVEGLVATARALGLDRTRLARRMPASSIARQPSVSSCPGFIELRSAHPLPTDRVVLRLTGRDGEQMEVSIQGEVLDVGAVMREFWNRAR